MITIVSVSAPLLLLLLVLTVVFLVCRRRKQAEKSEDLVHFQSVCTELQYITITDELRKYFNLLTYDILMFVLQLFQTITPLMVRKSRIISVLSRTTQRRRWIKDSVWRELCVKRIMIMSEKENERAANFLFSVGVEVKPDLFKNRINTTAR